jgi:hypothetical protein
MTKATSMERREPSLVRDWLRFFRYSFGGPSMILVLAAVAVVGGLAFDWSWLVASGLVPLLITLLPCAVMCGLGLCAHRLSGQHEGVGPARHDATSDRDGDRRDHSVISSHTQDCCGGGRSVKATAPETKVNGRRTSED